MAVKQKPSIGDIVIINREYFSENILISQYFENLKPSVQYEVIKIVDGYSPLMWGISVLRNLDTGEIIDIESIDQLKDYWCILLNTDSFRIVPQ